MQKTLRPKLIDIFRKAKAAGLTTSLDTNNDPVDRWSADVQLLLKSADILLPNADVLDMVGAGDSFDAGFVDQFIRGAKMKNV